MKKIINLKIILIALLIITISGCSKDEPSLQEKQLATLINNGKPWVLAANGVEKDGYTVTDQFSGFKLIFGDYTYSTQNSLPTAWAESGTWAFKGEEINSIFRDDGVDISLSINGTSLTMNFISIADAGGRVESLTGEYIFYLKSE